uniref:Uncharacterized protein n=1 Tax=Leersia perrieri TaxID=77586 RepID=A0A0D9UWP0_9ORYZ
MAARREQEATAAALGSIGVATVSTATTLAAAFKPPAAGGLVTDTFNHVALAGTFFAGVTLVGASSVCPTTRWLAVPPEGSCSSPPSRRSSLPWVYRWRRCCVRFLSPKIQSASPGFAFSGQFLAADLRRPSSARIWSIGVACGNMNTQGGCLLVRRIRTIRSDFRVGVEADGAVSKITVAVLLSFGLVTASLTINLATARDPPPVFGNSAYYHLAIADSFLAGMAQVAAAVWVADDPRYRHAVGKKIVYAAIAPLAVAIGLTGAALLR